MLLSIKLNYTLLQSIIQVHFHSVHHHSQIFKTITDEATGANRSLGLFGLSLKNVSDALYDIKTRGFGEFIFHTPAIDAEAVHKYNDALLSGIPAQEALRDASQGTNKATIALMKSANGLIISNEQLTATQEASTLAARAQSAALGVLSTVGSMAVTALVFKGIELAANAVDQYVNRVKYAVEAMEEAQQAIMDSQNRLRDVTATVEENRDRFIELSEGVDKFSGIENTIYAADPLRLHISYFRKSLYP